MLNSGATVLATLLATLTFGLITATMPVANAQTVPTSSAANNFDNFRPADYERLLTEANEAIEDGRFTIAEQSISDALQIIKVNHGLIAAEQIPALYLLARAYLVQQDWESLNQHLAYFEWLLGKLQMENLDAYLAGVEILNRLYLGTAADINNPQNAHYLIAAKQLNWRAVTALELRYGKQSLELAPWLYNITLTHYYQSILTNRRGMTSFDFKSETPEVVSGWSLSKNESVQQSFNIGYELLQRIRAIYARSEKASPTTDALIQLHLADWELLFDQGNAALTSYVKAFEAMEQSGLASATLQQLFMQPTIIPRPKLEDVLPASQQFESTPITFTAWSSVFPGAHQPSNLSGDFLLQSTKFLAAVKLDLESSLTQRELESLPARFTYQVTNATISSISPAGAIAEQLAMDQVNQLQFRPLWGSGEIQSQENVQLQYFFAADINNSDSGAIASP